ncbi:MAG: hypothetical protein WBB46_07585, partial [Candidatus Deferrimicrobiaceae bacterium]
RTRPTGDQDFLSRCHERNPGGKEKRPGIPEEGIFPGRFMKNAFPGRTIKTYIPVVSMKYPPSPQALPTPSTKDPE